MTEAGPAQRDLLLEGGEALRRGAWAEAREHFEAALQERETPQALEGLGTTETLERLGVVSKPAPANAESLALTGRELEVLALVADGLTDPQIAQQLVISEHTVHRHVSNILVKLSCSSRAAAVKRATAAGAL